MTEKWGSLVMCMTDLRVMPDKHDKLAFFQTQTLLQLIQQIGLQFVGYRSPCAECKKQRKAEPPTSASVVPPEQAEASRSCSSASVAGLPGTASGSVRAGAATSPPRKTGKKGQSGRGRRRPGINHVLKQDKQGPRRGRKTTKGSGAAATVSSKNEVRSSAEQQAAGTASSSSSMSPDVQEKTFSLNATPPGAPAPDGDDRRRSEHVYSPVPDRKELDRIVALWERTGRAAPTEAQVEGQKEVEKLYGPTEYWDVSQIGEDFGAGKDAGERWGPFRRCHKGRDFLSWSGAYLDTFKVSNWNTKGLTNMRMLFLNCRDFNQPLEWDLRAVTDFSHMFHMAHMGWKTGSAVSVRLARRILYFFFRTTTRTRSVLRCEVVHAYLPGKSCIVLLPQARGFWHASSPISVFARQQAASI